MSCIGISLPSRDGTEPSTCRQDRAQLRKGAFQMKRYSVAVFLVVATLFTLSREAASDPITAGSMVYSTPPEMMLISISGDRFRFDGRFHLSEPHFRS
jgi:hypothetical protein